MNYLPFKLLTVDGGMPCFYWLHMRILEKYCYAFMISCFIDSGLLVDPFIRGVFIKLGLKTVGVKYYLRSCTVWVRREDAEQTFDLEDALGTSTVKKLFTSIEEQG